MVMQNTAQRMPDAPDRFGQLLQVMDQLVNQPLPVIAHREAWIVPVLLQVMYLVSRSQQAEQFAVGG